MKTTTKGWSSQARFTASLLGVFLGLILGGCSDGRPKHVPVSGIVTVDDRPLTVGSISFTPVGGGRPSSGMIDDQGRFTLTGYTLGDGVPPGDYVVEVHASEHVGETKVKWHAPKKYRNKKTSGLTYTIEEPTDNLEIRLTWDGGKPFIETH